MSGGSLEYVYGKVEEAADLIASRSGKPLHRAFANHLRLVSEALHDLEWVYSGDYSEGDEDSAIRAVISPTAEVETARNSLVQAFKDAQDVLARLEGR